jgi:hypothetical protein
MLYCLLYVVIQQLCDEGRERGTAKILHSSLIYLDTNLIYRESLKRGECHRLLHSKALGKGVLKASRVSKTSHDVE